MMVIMKDSTFPWRFNDGENKLKAPNLLAVRDLRDSRQIFAQCSKEKSSWPSTVPKFSRVLCCLLEQRTCTMIQMGYLMRCSSNEGLSF